MRGWLVIPIVLLVAGGCAKARPQVRTEPIHLQVPPAPPRVIVPPEPEPVPAEPEPEPEKEAARPPRRSTPRPDPSKKPETPPPSAEPQAQVQPVPPPTESLEPVLRTSPREVERSVRRQLQRAQDDLNRIDYKGLTSDGKAQYDMAKRFSQQADQALAEKNLVFAGKLAEKAAGIASVLLGR